MKSRFGKLFEKFEGGGIRSAPASDEELLELYQEAKNLVDVMDDTGNKHSAYYFICLCSEISTVLRARNVPH